STPSPRSVSTTTYVAVQVIEAPTASVDDGHDGATTVPVPSNDTSSTVTSARGWLPTLVTRKLKVTDSPAAPTTTGSAVFSRVSASTASTPTTASSSADDTATSPGAVAVATAVLRTWPAAMSVAVTA